MTAPAVSYAVSLRHLRMRYRLGYTRPGTIPRWRRWTALDECANALARSIAEDVLSQRVPAPELLELYRRVRDRAERVCPPMIVP